MHGEDAILPVYRKQNAQYFRELIEQVLDTWKHKTSSPG
jgi:hypothetical protein